MNDYQIYTDASIDVPDHVLTENGIRVIPMPYTVDGEERVMENRLSDDQMLAFYQEMREGKLTKTSQAPPYSYQQAFRREAEAGTGVLYLALAAGLSNTWNSSCTACRALKEEFPDFRGEMVDTASATVGMGLMLMEAVKNKKNGMTLEENAAALRETLKHVAVWFMVDDLKYLCRGGRISAATAFAGTMLNLKPILKINEDGTLTSFAKQRGVGKAMSYLVKTFDASKMPELGKTVLIAHADCPERAEELKKRVLEEMPDAEVEITSLNPFIGCHTGPGLCAIAHFGDPNFL